MAALMHHRFKSLFINSLTTHGLNMKLTHHFSFSMAVAGSALLLLACSTTEDQHANHQASYKASHNMKSAAKAVAAGSDCADSAFYQPLQPPATLYSATTIETTLKAETVTKCVAGKAVLLKSYVDNNAGTDNRPVGPTYVMEVGENKTPGLHINFYNQLADPGATDYDCSHHGANVDVCTNLHTHGFHVSPKGSDDLSAVQSDYVFIKIPPRNDSVRYEFDLPKGHAPGTHWLHAHLHGSTSPQVRNGMAGALILKGDLDKTLENEYGISGDKDRVMILQQLQDLSTGEALCGAGITTSINGQCLPVIEVTAGDVERWRFIHSGISATVNIGLQSDTGSLSDLYEFARDGITLNGYQTAQNILLQPGYRSDVLVKFPTCLSYPCEQYLIDGVSQAKNSLYGKSEPQNLIAKVVINSPVGRTAALLPPSSLFVNPYPFICDNPATFDECAQSIASRDGVEKVKFANVPNGDNPPLKTVNRGLHNGKMYSGVFPDTPVKTLPLNGRNTWKLWVGTEQNANGPNHPFHIHVNPFQVKDENGFMYWKDTLLVSGTDNHGEDKALTVLSRYENFTGDFVLHCHNLDHEDDGMMMEVKIQ